MGRTTPIVCHVVSPNSFVPYKAQNFFKWSAAFSKYDVSKKRHKFVIVVLVDLFLYIKLKKARTTSLNCTCRLKSVNSNLAKSLPSTYNFKLDLPGYLLFVARTLRLPTYYFFSILFYYTISTC